MPETRFWPPLGVFGLFWGRLRLTHNLGNAESPKIQNSKIFLVLRALVKKNFRLLKHPKRLGLGQQVPGKYPFGPNEYRFVGPEDYVVQGQGVQGPIGGG